MAYERSGNTGQFMFKFSQETRKMVQNVEELNEKILKKELL